VRLVPATEAYEYPQDPDRCRLALLVYSFLVYCIIPRELAQAFPKMSIRKKIHREMNRYYIHQKNLQPLSSGALHASD